MPDGTAGMFIVLDATTRTNSDDLAIIVGPRASSSLIGASAAKTLIGVQFTSGGAGPFINVSLSELAHTHAPLRYVADPAAAVLRERLLASTSPPERLDILEGWLMQRLLRRRDSEDPIQWAVRVIERSPHMRMQDVAARIGRSSRWFIQRFSNEVGLTPKVFGRVRRFHAAVALMHRRPQIDLTGLACRSATPIRPTSLMNSARSAASHLRSTWRDARHTPTTSRSTEVKFLQDGSVNGCDSDAHGGCRHAQRCP
jgi:AraC-like DNA-binding protein